jgi:acetate kinase
VPATIKEPIVGVINAGSSSLKYALYEGDSPLAWGEVNWGGRQPTAKAFGLRGQALEPPAFGSGLASTPSELMPTLMHWARKELGGQRIAALGHRVVHGGMGHAGPALVTNELLEELEALIPLAPLHQPHNLTAIRSAMALDPILPQVACFDTGFHRTIPAKGQAFALPWELYERGIRRYGFHGLSYEYIASALPKIAPEIAAGRVVVAHLGNGASLCALEAGRSIATTMGFSALDGLPMGTRCGELDPGVILYLLRQEKMSLETLEQLLYRQSGMLGLSGLTSDFRDLLESDDPRSRFAIEVFCHQVALQVGSLAAALRGLDGIVFTAGVGENAAQVRSTISSLCGWLGLKLNEDANHRHAPRISTEGSQVAAYVIPTNENLIIARHTRALSGLE